MFTFVSILLVLALCAYAYLAVSTARLARKIRRAQLLAMYHGAVPPALANVEAVDVMLDAVLIHAEVLFTRPNRCGPNPFVSSGNLPMTAPVQTPVRIAVLVDLDETYVKVLERVQRKPLRGGRFAHGWR